MSELIALASQLGGVGFPTLLVMILYGSYRKWWIWGHVYTARETEWAKRELEYEKRLTKEEQSKTRWESMALGTVGLVEDKIATKRNGSP